MTKPTMPMLAMTAMMALVPSLAYAHTGVGDPIGFAHGFIHPITGIDHVLAMVMVGMFAWQLGGRALWLVPTTFVLSWRLAARSASPASACRSSKPVSLSR